MRRYHRTMLAAALLMLMAFPAHAEDTSVASPDPLKLYGQEYDFVIRRNGNKIGKHKLTFSQSDDTLTVMAKTDIKVKLLFVTVYRFDYDCTEIWSGKQLDSLKAEVNDNGKRYEISLEHQNDTFTVNGPEDHGDTKVVTYPFFPTNHWNKNVLFYTQLFNTLTGRINTVEIEKSPLEKIQTENGTIDAYRYTYSGELETEAWYDTNGRWVKLAFKNDDGSNIEYLCTNCAPQTLAKLN